MVPYIDSSARPVHTQHYGKTEAEKAKIFHQADVDVVLADATKLERSTYRTGVTAGSIFLGIGGAALLTCITLAIIGARVTHNPHMFITGVLVTPLALAALAPGIGILCCTKHRRKATDEKHDLALAPNVDDSIRAQFIKQNPGLFTRCEIYSCYYKKVFNGTMQDENINNLTLATFKAHLNAAKSGGFVITDEEIVRDAINSKVLAANNSSFRDALINEYGKDLTQLTLSMKDLSPVFLSHGTLPKLERLTINLDKGFIADYILPLIQRTTDRELKSVTIHGISDECNEVLRGQHNFLASNNVKKDHSEAKGTSISYSTVRNLPV